MAAVVILAKHAGFKLPCNIATNVTLVETNNRTNFQLSQLTRAGFVTIARLTH